jgi:hypothetical protein
LFFFKLGRPWPVFLGTGIGLGMGYSNCQNDFRSPYVHPQTVRKKNMKLIKSNYNYFFYRNRQAVNDLSVELQYEHK